MDILLSQVMRYFSFLILFRYIKLFIRLERLNIKSIAFEDIILIPGTEVKLQCDVSGAYQIRVCGNDYVGTKRSFRFLVPEIETDIAVQLFGLFETRTYMLSVRPILTPEFDFPISNDQIKIILPEIRHKLFDDQMARSRLELRSDIRINQSKIDHYKLKIPRIQFNHSTPYR
ncbi:MAG: hypothetical protein H6568_07445 [Lewinellaceae bacterium]|nr:hypothetical protein [Saprospiraceae bacterium]MCB9312587.1 hypothetical protein [Lewinellaceae bacterium]